MTAVNHEAWAAHHRRGDVLRAVVDHADAHRDGHLPTHLPGVAETFRDETDLVAALQLRWHTRLAGQVERALMEKPEDPETAVLTAWRATADELAGVRRVLDRAAARPADGQMATALRRAAATEHTMLAVMAGQAAMDDAHAPAVGRALEQRARAMHRPSRPTSREAASAGGQCTLLGRLRAVLAA